MVTAELALGMLAAGVLVVVALWAVGIAGQQLALGDVAVQVARQEARGDSAAVRELERRHPHVRIEVARQGGLAEVTVTRRTDAFGLLPPVVLRAQATSHLEPGER